MARVLTTVRRAGAEDVEGILEIERASFSKLEAFKRRQVRGLVSNGNAVVLVAMSGNNVIGWGVGLIRKQSSRKSGRIYSIAVGRAERGRGVGKILLRRLIGEIQKRGAARIFLEVQWNNRAAIALYKKLGFRSIKTIRDYYAKGTHAEKMVREK